MAVLIEAQGDMLDNIEAQVRGERKYEFFVQMCMLFENSVFVIFFLCMQVTNADDHIQSGIGALQKARRLQKNTRKCTCIAIIILIIIIAVVLLVVLKPWSKN